MKKVEGPLDISTKCMDAKVSTPATRSDPKIRQTSLMLE
ncbi:MAG: hypothetical protein BWY72_02340 [Bacteroidetes bacterium ADurb.Bin416]|nr:MAG: hypothetical protein BWY72_02340 [Bacteroidetes bacterium ADurb.Bin416]